MKKKYNCLTKEFLVLANLLTFYFSMTNADVNCPFFFLLFVCMRECLFYFSVFFCFNVNEEQKKEKDDVPKKS